MADLAKTFVKDNEKVRDGVWVNIGGIDWKLTYFNASKTQVKFQAELNRLLVEGVEKVEASIQATRHVLIEDVVLDWEDLQDEGVTVKYSKESLKIFLEKYIGLEAMLMSEAMAIQHFREALQKETAEK